MPGGRCLAGEQSGAERRLFGNWKVVVILEQAASKDELHLFGSQPIQKSKIPPPGVRGGWQTAPERPESKYLPKYVPVLSFRMVQGKGFRTFSPWTSRPVTILFYEITWVPKDERMKRNLVGRK
jgi:hypothetical protein